MIMVKADIQNTSIELYRFRNTETKIIVNRISTLHYLLILPNLEKSLSIGIDFVFSD